MSVHLGWLSATESLGAGEGAKAQIKTGQEGVSCLWNEIGAGMCECALFFTKPGEPV